MQILLVYQILFYTPHFNEVGRGILVSACLSVHPSVDRIVSVLYLQQYFLDPFHAYISYQATPEGVSHGKIFAIFLKC